MKSVVTHLLPLILFGGVFIISEHFMNIENDAKTYFIGVLQAICHSIKQNDVLLLEKRIDDIERLTLLFMDLSPDFQWNRFIRTNNKIK